MADSLQGQYSKFKLRIQSWNTPFVIWHFKSIKLRGPNAHLDFSRERERVWHHWLAFKWHICTDRNLADIIIKKHCITVFIYRLAQSMARPWDYISDYWTPKGLNCLQYKETYGAGKCSVGMLIVIFVDYILVVFVSLNLAFNMLLKTSWRGI